MEAVAGRHGGGWLFSGPNGAKTMTTKKRPTIAKLTQDYGILLDGRLVYQTMDMNKAISFKQKHGGTLIHSLDSSEASERRRKKKEREENKLRNPLAQKLTCRLSALIEAIGDGRPTLIDSFDEPDGIAGDWKDKRRATNKESSTGSICLHPDPKFSLKGSPEDVTRSIIDSLRQYSRDILAEARTIEIELKKRLLPLSPIVGHYVVKDGKRIAGPFLSRHAAVRWENAHRRYGEIVRVFADGTDDSQTEATEVAAAK